MRFQGFLCVMFGRAGPFAKVAGELLAHDRVPIPCNGKRPIAKGWQKQTPAEVRNNLRSRIGRFGSANVGISCGPSRLVVVDIDQPELLEAMRERFGPTGLIVRSPRGGYHL